MFITMVWICLRRMQPPFFNICPVLIFSTLGLHDIFYLHGCRLQFHWFVCCRGLSSICLQHPWLFFHREIMAAFTVNTNYKYSVGTEHRGALLWLGQINVGLHIILLWNERWIKAAINLNLCLSFITSAHCNYSGNTWTCFAAICEVHF